MAISEITKLENTGFEVRSIQIFIKRDDLVHQGCQGNKFRKLKYHVLEARKKGKSQLLSFGGAYSNHLFALAYYGHTYGWPTIGIIRGEIDKGNPTIQALLKWEMQLIPVDRSSYRRRHDKVFQSNWINRFPDAYLIPEGGSQLLGMKGIGELPREVSEQTHLQFDFWVCPFATGATTAGLASSLPSPSRLWAFTVLKGLDHAQILTDYALEEDVLKKITVVEAPLGGFARRNETLESFITEFYRIHGILLDPIYTGKMMLGLFRKLQAEKCWKDLNILVIHTGGLQGIRGYNARFNTNLPVQSSS